MGRHYPIPAVPLFEGQNDYWVVLVVWHNVHFDLVSRWVPFSSLSHAPLNISLEQLLILNSTWDAYYSSYLQVVHNQSITHAGYILNSFSLTSAFISPFIGLIIRYTGNVKYTACAGIPFVVLGTALLIPLRTPSTHVGLLVMCQLFNGIGTGIFATCGQLAVMAAVTHQEIAVATALWGMFGSIGAAVGLTIAGGLWTNVLPGALVRELPEGSKDLAATIYSSLVIQQEYPVGTEVRDAIIRAYADVQRKMVIAGCGFVPLLVVCILMWRNLNVKKLEEHRSQAKGTIW
jgi:hypothetical protein